VIFTRMSPMFEHRLGPIGSGAPPRAESVPRAGHAPRRPIERAVPGLLLCAGLALGLGCSSAEDAVNDAAGGGSSGSDAFSQIYASDTFGKCSGCHAPGAAGKTEGTEATQDWSTRDKAYSTLHQTASGLMGNFAGCNGVPFLGSNSAQSLLVASLDADTRANYQNAQFPDCNADAISDQTLKVGPIPGGLLTQLKSWIDSGAPDK
jgi:hypothetical protein